LFFALFVGQLMKQVSMKCKIPYTSMITIFGLVIGIYSKHLGRLGEAIKAWSRIDPHLLLLVFLPALIFESAFKSDWHIFKVEFA
jgi:NhaP-type Na+/H+ or K+/H+ antiporter